MIYQPDIAKSAISPKGGDVSVPEHTTAPVPASSTHMPATDTAYRRVLTCSVKRHHVRMCGNHKCASAHTDTRDTRYKHACVYTHRVGFPGQSGMP